MSVRKARAEQGKLVFVEGHYLSRDGVARICDRLVGSNPPQCNGLLARGYKPSPNVEVKRAGGVVWTVDPVRVFGDVNGNKLRVGGCA
jgi:hypothetical protein